MKFKLCEWENNGYHDSDFYGVYYDAETNEVCDILIGSTRFASSPCVPWQSAVMPTPEIAERARLILRDHIHANLILAEMADIMTPNDAKKGDVLKLTEPHQRQLKAPVPCEKCAGDGFWQNPRNATDRRACFACGGTGLVAKGDPLKDASGKVRKETIHTHSRIHVLGCKAFGTFYAKGYNHPCRANRSVTGKLDNGTIVNVPLKKCRLDKEPMTSAELMARAEKLSHHHQYDAMFGGCAWLSANYAKQAATAAKSAA